jgi:hypothetical protein
MPELLTLAAVSFRKIADTSVSPSQIGVSRQLGMYRERKTSRAFYSRGLLCKIRTPENNIITNYVVSISVE